MYAGQYAEVLYRCVAWSHYIVHAADYTPEVYAAVRQWMDKCEEESIDFFDSIIDMYNTGGYIGTEKMAIFSGYKPEFDKAVKFLLGEEAWNPPAFVEQKARESALCYTKVHLTHLLEKTLSPNEQI